MGKNDIKFTDEELERELKKKETGAVALLESESDTEDMINKASIKISKSNAFKDIIEDVKLLGCMVKDYIKGNYKKIPVGVAVSILGAFSYFISPIDLIPDFIPLLGLTDDAAVFGFVLAGISSDLDDYKQWRLNQGFVTE